MTLRLAILGATALAGLATLTATPARAGDEAPSFVIPSRPGIPIVINGCDASYAVVEGDWGLARPGHVAVTVFGCKPLLSNAVYSRRAAYHPRYGRAPLRGRQEIEPAPDRPLPDLSESYSRSWSTSSDPTYNNDPARPTQVRGDNYDPADVPATITDPATFPNLNNMPVIVAPRRRR